MISQIKDLVSEKKSIPKIIRSCMIKNGLNKYHSRSLVLGEKESYRERQQGKMSAKEFLSYAEEASVIILKYFAKKYLKLLKENNYDMSLPLNTYFEEINNNKLTGNDLLNIINNQSKKIGDYRPNIGSIINEHFNSRVLYGEYGAESAMPGEKLMDIFNFYYSKRFYLNFPENSVITLSFGIEFIKKCIDMGIPYDMKLIGAIGKGQLDGTVIYSKNKYFKDHFKIIRNLLSNHKEYKEVMGSPIYTGGTVIEDDGKCYFSISHGGNKEMFLTYNDVVDRVINLSYTYTCIELINEYYPFFAKKFSKDTLTRIMEIRSGKTPLQVIGELKKLQDEVRRTVYEYLKWIKNKPIYEERCKFIYERMYANMRTFKSLVNFGDLNHQDNPIYEDHNFELLRESLSKAAPSGGAPRK